MTIARRLQIILPEVCFVHCFMRCVRRAFLCGNDPLTGKNFDHRRVWLIERMKFLSSHFAIDVCAYAIMSNHFHVVLNIALERAAAMSDEEVIAHGLALFPSFEDKIELLNVANRTEEQQEELDALVNEWRSRLTDTSWFMRCLAEHIARMANREDDCTGRFWEGRFKSKALLDDRALLTCMAYVDLNQLNAGVGDSLDTSDYTSIQERLFEYARRAKNRNARQNRLFNRKQARHLRDRKCGANRAALKPFSGMPGVTGDTLPIEEESYIELLECSCRALGLINKSKGRAMQLLDGQRESLDSIGIGAASWLDAVRKIDEFRSVAIGSKQALEAYHRLRKEKGANYKHDDKYVQGVGPAKKLFDT